MAGVEELVLLYLFNRPMGYLEVPSTRSCVSPYACVADDLQLSVDQVKGSLANLQRIGQATSYETSEGSHRYLLSDTGKMRASRRQENLNDREQELVLPEFALSSL